MVETEDTPCDSFQIPKIIKNTNKPKKTTIKSDKRSEKEVKITMKNKKHQEKFGKPEKSN